MRETSHFVKAVCPLHVSSPLDGSTIEVSLSRSTGDRTDLKAISVKCWNSFLELQSEKLRVIFLSCGFSLRIKFPPLSMDEEWGKNKVKY